MVSVAECLTSKPIGGILSVFRGHILFVVKKEFIEPLQEKKFLRHKVQGAGFQLNFFLQDQAYVCVKKVKINKDKTQVDNRVSFETAVDGDYD